MQQNKTNQNQMKSHYEILEVEPGATQDEIREQYLFLIQAWHPDKFPKAAQKAKAEEKTKEINAAYEILRNTAKRAEYDRSTRSSTPRQKQEYRGRGKTYTSGRPAKDERQRTETGRQEEEQLRKERADRKRAASAFTRIRVFMDGQERILGVGELVKATVQYINEETKEDMGLDTFRTHAAVRAAASRCLKHRVEIHIRELAR